MNSNRVRALLRSFAGVFLSIFLPLACETRDAPYPSGPFQEGLVVEGMLVAGQTEQEILIERVRGIAEGYFRGITPVSGLQVTVSAGDRTYALAENTTPGFYEAAFTPTPGQRYQLHIISPTGDVVTAETVIPSAPEIVEPGTDTTVQTTQSLGTQVRLSWTASPASGGYVVVRRFLGEQGATRDPSELFAGTSVVHGTTALVGIGDQTYQAAGSAVIVAAVDSNYVHYADRGVVNPQPMSLARSTVVGGYGIFGSVAESATRTILAEFQ